MYDKSLVLGFVRELTIEKLAYTAPVAASGGQQPQLPQLGATGTVQSGLLQQASQAGSDANARVNAAVQPSAAPATGRVHPQAVSTILNNTPGARKVVQPDGGKVALASVKLAVSEQYTPPPITPGQAQFVDRNVIKPTIAAASTVNQRVVQPVSAVANYVGDRVSPVVSRALPYMAAASHQAAMSEAAPEQVTPTSYRANVQANQNLMKDWQQNYPATHRLVTGAPGDILSGFGAGKLLQGAGMGARAIGGSLAQAGREAGQLGRAASGAVRQGMAGAAEAMAPEGAMVGMGGARMPVPSRPVPNVMEARGVQAPTALSTSPTPPTGAAAAGKAPVTPAAAPATAPAPAVDPYAPVSKDYLKFRKAMDKSSPLGPGTRGIVAPVAEDMAPTYRVGKNMAADLADLKATRKESPLWTSIQRNVARPIIGRESPAVLQKFPGPLGDVSVPVPGTGESISMPALRSMAGKAADGASQAAGLMSQLPVVGKLFGAGSPFVQAGRFVEAGAGALSPTIREVAPAIKPGFLRNPLADAVRPGEIGIGRTSAAVATAGLGATGLRQAYQAGLSPVGGPTREQASQDAALREAGHDPAAFRARVQAQQNWSPQGASPQAAQPAAPVAAPVVAASPAAPSDSIYGSRPPAPKRGRK